MDDKVTEKAIMKMACGQDDNGISNSVIKVSMTRINVSTEEENIVYEATLDGPVVDIFRGYRLTQIDLKFSNSGNYDLINLNQRLNEFTTIANSLDEEAEDIPAIIVTIMPKDYEGEYFISGLHGAWCLMPNEAGDDIATIRFIFENPLVHVYRINDTDVDYKELESELILDTYAERE